MEGWAIMGQPARQRGDDTYRQITDITARLTANESNVTNLTTAVGKLTDQQGNLITATQVLTNAEATLSQRINGAERAIDEIRDAQSRVAVENEREHARIERSVSSAQIDIQQVIQSTVSAAFQQALQINASQAQTQNALTQNTQASIADTRAQTGKIDDRLYGFIEKALIGGAGIILTIIFQHLKF